MNLTKISSSQIDYFLVFMMVVMSAGVSFLGATIFRFLLLLIVMFVILLRNKSIYLNNFTYILIFYFIWCTSVFYMFNVNIINSGQLLTYLSFFTLIITSYYAAVAVNDIFTTYIRVIYHLAIISFFFYSIQLINLDLLITILRNFDGLNSIFKDEISRPSIIIFTYGTDSGVSLRNYGFATEPGEFSVFLILALILQVTRNNFAIDRTVIVLITAVLTTTSTSGYLALVIVLIYVMYNKNINYNKIFFVLLAIPAIFIILNQNFVLDKIQEALQDETSEYETAYQERITPGRVGSMLLDFNDFKENPIIGYGMHKDTRYANYGMIEQQRTNGVTDYLVKFGIFGFLIMLYNYYKTFNLLTISNKLNIPIFIISSIIIVSFSQIILTTPIFFTMQFYHYKMIRN